MDHRLRDHLHPLRKWRFQAGHNEPAFHAAIYDDAFLNRVEDGIEAFRKHDMLRGVVESVQVPMPDGSVRMERRITQVIEHVSSAEQLRLQAPPRST